MAMFLFLAAAYFALMGTVLVFVSALCRAAGRDARESD